MRSCMHSLVTQLRCIWKIGGLFNYSILGPGETSSQNVHISPSVFSISKIQACDLTTQENIVTM